MRRNVLLSMLSILAVAAVVALATPMSGGAITHAKSSVTIAGGDFLGGAPVYIASQEGLWAKNGVTATVDNFSTGVDALDALLGGQATYAFAAELPVATSILNGRDIKIDAVLSRFSDWRLLTTTTSGVSSFADLKGKRIGVPIGTNAEYALDTMLSSAGLTLSDVTLVNLSPSQVVPTLSQGGIQAGVTFPSFYPAAASTLGVHERELKFKGYTQYTVLVSRADTPSSETKAVLKTLDQADAVIKAQPTRAEGYIVEQAKGADEPSFVKQFLPEYSEQLLLSRGLVDLLETEGKWLHATQGLSDSATDQTFLDSIETSPLKAVDPSAVSLAAAG